MHFYRFKPVRIYIDRILLTTSSSYTPSGSGPAQSGRGVAFGYDGDGQRIKSVVGTTLTTFIGSYFEWTGSTSTMLKYHYAGGARVAMRQGSMLYFLLTDHLGSTQKMANADGSNYTTHLYKAWGEKRYPAGPSTLLTTFRFTGQREQVEIGLYFYGARWYDSLLGRMAQADTIVPDAGNPMAWDRYAYANNNPLYFTDPDGHCPVPSGSGAVICIDLFIQTKNIMGFLGRGDNRTFSSNSDPSQSRGYVYIRLDDAGNVSGVEPHVDNPSIGPLGAPFGPYDEYNNFTVSQNPDTDDISVEWDLLNGVAGAFRTADENASGLEKVFTAAALGVLDAMGMNEPINGQLTLSPDPQTGEYSLATLNTDPYPSIEIYYYENGQLKRVLYADPEWPRGRPDKGLKPDAQRRVYPD